MSKHDLIDSEIEKMMMMNYRHPDVDDPDLQYKLYQKREFNSKQPQANASYQDMEYEDVKDLRLATCRPEKFQLRPHQELLGNLINPNTPYKGILIYHGLGTGKTCVGMAIAEQFKEMVMKYNTKIFILVPGPILKARWKSGIIECSGNAYLSIDETMTAEEVGKRKKQALIDALQYYRILSFNGFHRRVLGVGKKMEKGQKKKTYSKTEDGEFERDFSSDRIYNLNNTLLIIDEAHGFTGNNRGVALRKVINNSSNLRVVLMSGTPMKNFASEIVELVNFLRPIDSQMEREKIFTSQKGHMMEIKKGGIEYFKKMINGYVSHYRGSDPLTFSRRVDHGVIPKGLIFTKLMRYMMSDFQRKVYDEEVVGTVREFDKLDKKSEAIANFVFPGLSPDKKSLVGLFGKQGLDRLKENIRTSGDQLNELLENFFASKNIKTEDNAGQQDFIRLTDDGKMVTGRIYRSPYLEFFSIKFARALARINRMVWGKKGPCTAFIYSNLVKVGINIFREILLQNGYVEFQEEFSNYDIRPETVCYYCGIMRANHQPQTHDFYPAAFLAITGKSSEEKASESSADDINNILDNYLNKPENREGKYIKLILGSRVINEGINMIGIRQVHILDVYFNFGRVDQVVGRAIRQCSHLYHVSPQDPFPCVDVYKYVVITNEDASMGLSSEEELYQKAEQKHLLIKKIERAMKEKAVDCAINLRQNIFPDEIRQYKDCDIRGENKCPDICDYTRCDYHCDNNRLNAEYYDPSRMLYRLVDQKDIDMTTFNYSLEKTEIENAKNIIKNMYQINHFYRLEEIIEHVRKTYQKNETKIFDEFFVYRALDALVPLTENDFNNFKDDIRDRNNKLGYLIHRSEYYIFQPYDQNENVPMIYRINNYEKLPNNISIYNYLKNQDIEQQRKKKKDIDTNKGYNFNDTYEYYEEREEYEYVGAVDMDLDQQKNKRGGITRDVFKIRPRLGKILEKKRGTGIYTMNGAVCDISKSKKELNSILRKLDLPIIRGVTRIDICSSIKNELMRREKYSTTENNNKITYLRVPANHPTIPFPLNLEDRIAHFTDQIKPFINVNQLNVKKIFDNPSEKELFREYHFVVSFKDNPKLSQAKEILEYYQASITDGSWTIVMK